MTTLSADRPALRFSSILIPLLFLATAQPLVSAQDDEAEGTQSETQVEDPTGVDPEEGLEAPDAVNVTEVVDDNQIVDRLLEILESTEWFTDEDVEVRNGVVFLGGTTDDESYRTWAGDLARKTEDVVAVVNRIKVRQPPLFDFQPAFDVIEGLIRSVIRALPLIIISIVLLIMSWFIARGVQRLADLTFLKHVETALLREVGRKAIAIPVLLLGVFLILRVTGLTQLAMTVVGGTGLVGLVIGIAFRDIAENFLSSILLSIQNPFRYGDLIEVGSHLGFVQRVNTRGTLLMTPEGNHVQIPNSDIFKGTITNFTSNPGRRFSFQIGIGYDASATKAQETAMGVLKQHPAILSEPEPLVLVEQLASSTINLMIYAWVDGNQHSWVKVKSSVIRLVLQAFEQEGFSMPDDQREIVFPSGVPVQMLEQQRDLPAQTAIPKTGALEGEDVSNAAEGDFRSEADEVNEQAKNARDPEGDDTDLLAESGKDKPSSSQTA